METQESARTVGGVPLKPRKEVAPKTRRRKSKSKAKSPPPLTEQEQENVELSNAEMGRIAALLDPDSEHAVDVQLDGEPRKVRVFKCKARQIGYVMRFLSNAFKAMKVETFTDAAEMTAGLSNPHVVVSLLADVMDEALFTAAIMTDLELEQMKDLEVDDALAVVLKVWAVNQSFFSLRVMPMILGMIGQGNPSTSGSVPKTPEDSDINISME